MIFLLIIITSIYKFQKKNIEMRIFKLKIILQLFLVLKFWSLLSIFFYYLNICYILITYCNSRKIIVKLKSKPKSILAIKLM